jgi:hypothetical protein
MGDGAGGLIWVALGGWSADSAVGPNVRFAVARDLGGGVWD